MMDCFIIMELGGIWRMGMYRRILPVLFIMKMAGGM